MNLLAATLVGSACALLAGFLTGCAPRLGFRGRRRRSVFERRRLWLQQAGVAVSPAQFLAGSTLAGAVALAVLAALTGSLFVAAVPALAVALLPRAYFGRRRAARLRLVQEAWPDGLRDLLASIVAGRSVGQAVSALAVGGPEPLREAFARFPQMARMLGTGPALEIVKEEIADPTSDRVLEVLILAHERGGAIVRTILEDLVEAIGKDLKLQAAIATEGLEMRINARAVVVLPWLVLVALTARDGPFRDFYRGPGGVVTLLLGGALSLAGVAVLGRLGRDPGEERVFDARGRNSR